MPFWKVAQKQEKLTFSNTNNTAVMAETVKIGEEVFELQKRATGLHDWEHTASEYVDAKLQAKSKDAVTLPNDTWQWITEWKCDGADAWEFATFKGGPYHYGETVFDFFRRRKWYRYRIKQGVTQEELQRIIFCKFYIFGRNCGSVSQAIYNFEEQQNP